MVQHYHLVAKIGVDTAENGLLKVCQKMPNVRKNLEEVQRYGLMSTEMRGFFERIERIGGAQALVGKPASLFASAPTVGGGTESAMHSAVALLAHLGMVFVYVFSNSEFNGFFITSTSF